MPKASIKAKISATTKWGLALETVYTRTLEILSRFGGDVGFESKNARKSRHVQGCLCFQRRPCVWCSMPRPISRSCVGRCPGPCPALCSGPSLLARIPQLVSQSGSFSMSGCHVSISDRRDLHAGNTLLVKAYDAESGIWSVWRCGRCPGAMVSMVIGVSFGCWLLSWLASPGIPVSDFRLCVDSPGFSGHGELSFPCEEMS